MRRFFEKLKAENPGLRRRNSEKEKYQSEASAESNMLEFPSRKVSVSISRQNSGVVGEVSENFSSTKDMWKKRESLNGELQPILPKGYKSREASKKSEFSVESESKLERSESISADEPISREESITRADSVLSREGLGASDSRQSSAKDFWKKKETAQGLNKAVFPRNYSTASEIAPLQREFSSKRSSRRLSIDGISIPVVDIVKENNSEDVFHIPEGPVSVAQFTRRGSKSPSRPSSPSRSGRNSPTLRETPAAMSRRVSGRSLTPPSSEPLLDVGFLTNNAVKAVPGTETPPDSASTMYNSPKSTPRRAVEESVSSSTTYFSPGFDAFDPDRVFDDEMPIVLIEIGESEARMGLWNVKKRCFDQRSLSFYHTAMLLK